MCSVQINLRDQFSVQSRPTSRQWDTSDTWLLTPGHDIWYPTYCDTLSSTNQIPLCVAWQDLTWYLIPSFVTWLNCVTVWQSVTLPCYKLCDQWVTENMMINMGLIWSEFHDTKHVTNCYPHQMSADWYYLNWGCLKRKGIEYLFFVFYTYILLKILSGALKSYLNLASYHYLWGTLMIPTRSF